MSSSFQKLIVSAFLLMHPILSGMSINCIDVGQGSCTVIVPKEPSSDILVVDCGSSSNKARTSVVKKNNRALLVQCIIKNITDTNKNSSTDKQVTFIITHADDDHCNLLGPVITQLLGAPYNIPVKKIFFGGYREDYSEVELGSDKIPFVAFLKKLEEFKVEYYFPSVVPLTESIPGGYAHLFIVPKESAPDRLSKKYDTNRMSLITRIEFDGKTCLIMGDATNDTTRHHVKVLKTANNDDDSPGGIEKLSADIYIASHHGASSNCNEPYWLETIKPSFIVVSSGVHSEFRHPREEAVKVFLNRLSSQSGKLHSFYFGLEEPDDFSQKSTRLDHAVFKDGYGVLFSDKHLYGTLGQGNITFFLEKGSSLKAPECSRSYSFYKDEPSVALLKRCLPSSDEGKNLLIDNLGEPLKYCCFSLENAVYLNLSSFNTSADCALLISLILDSLLQAKDPAIKMLHLENNKLSNHDDIIEKIAKLVKAKSLVLLMLKGNTLQELQQTKIKEAWGHRGLEL